MVHRSLLAMIALLGLSSSAQAGDWGLTLGKRSKHGQVSLHLGSHGAGISYRDRRFADRRYGPRRVARGHYRTVSERVWVPGTTERVWVPERYEVWVDVCGIEHRRLVAPGYYETLRHPGHYDVRTRRVWVPAHSYGHTYGHGYGGITRH